MPLMVARPFKNRKTGFYWLRRAVPESLRPLVGKREEKFNLGTCDPEEAKRLHAKAIAEMDARWANLRQGQRILTEREANELAKPLFHKWLELFEDDPGNQLHWYPELYDRFTLFSETDLLAPLNKEIEDDEQAVDVHLDDLQLASMRTFARAQAQYLLEAHGMRVDGYSFLKLARACAIALQRASLLLDHSHQTGEPVKLEEEQGPAGTFARKTLSTFPMPDPRGAIGRMPQSAGGRARPDALSLSDLLDAWWKEAKAVGRKPSTYESYRNTVAAFIAFVGYDDATRVNESDVVAFKDHRLSTPSNRTGKPPSAKTVKDSDLSALKTLFGWAVSNRKLNLNPATGITIKLAKQPRLRPKWFTDAEAQQILMAALTLIPSGDAPQLQAAKRWVPWLCSFTGARVGELAQLRKEDILNERVTG